MTDKQACSTIGIVSCLLIGATGMAFFDALQFVLGDWLGCPQAETIGRLILIITAACAVGSLLLWMLRGERMRKRCYGTWIPGALLGIPIAAIVSILLGAVCRINESQAWMDADLMFRISRMLSAATMPLTVLGCWLYVAVRRRNNK